MASTEKRYHPRQLVICQSGKAAILTASDMPVIVSIGAEQLISDWV